MATTLTLGFYREVCGEAGVLYVDEAGTLWLVLTGDDADLPWRLEDELAVGIEPFPDIRPDDAAEYRGMVERRGPPRRRRPGGSCRRCSDRDDPGRLAMPLLPGMEDDEPAMAAQLAPKLRELAGRGIYLGMSS
jgi:hypothetical protein